MERGVYTLKRPSISAKAEKKGGSPSIRSRIYHGTWEDFLTMMEHLSVGILLKDWNCSYLYCNNTYARHLGLPKDSILGKQDHDLLSAEMAEEASDSERCVLEGEKEEHQTLWNLGDAAHGDKWVSVRRQPIWNEWGEIAYVLGVTEEVPVNVHGATVMRVPASNDRVPAACVRATDCDRCASFSDVNLEIRTILNAVIGLTQNAQQAEDTRKIESCLEKIRTASSALLCILHDLPDKLNSQTMDAMDELSGYMATPGADGKLGCINSFAEASGHMETLKVILEKEGIMLD